MQSTCKVLHYVPMTPTTPIHKVIQPTTSMGTRWLSIAQACEYLSCSRWFLYKLIADGTLQARKVGGMYRVSLAALDAVFEVTR